MHELFEEQAKRRGERVAVEYEGEQMSYGKLNERANQVGHYLRKLGVGPEVRVGICVERGMEMVVGLMGVLKAGGAYVPLDVGWPEERLRYMVEESEAVVVVTQKKVLEKVREVWEGREEGVKVVCLDGEEAEQEGGWKKESRGEVKSGVRRENLAYVLYTSGSTGRPKGVMIEHRQITADHELLCRGEGESGGGGRKRRRHKRRM
jgi:non-ribosomal peptide synthetase component F